MAHLRTLFPHQMRALEYARQRSRIALFMEMRLGKTAVAIRWARDRKLDRVLVLGPSSVLPGWIDELMIEGVRASDIHYLTGSTHARLSIAQEIDTGWALTNYEAIRLQPQLLGLNWDALILDESTRIRNPKAQVTKLILAHARDITHRAVLSGMPAPESPLDYWCQMAFLHGEFLRTWNYWAFRKRYFLPNVRGYDWQPMPGVIEDIKREVHTTAFVLTRKAAGMGEKKIYERRYVDMNPQQLRAYRQVAREWAYKDQDTQWATTRLLWLARLAGGFAPDTDTHPEPQLVSGTKFDELVSLLTEELKDEPAVVWFRFTAELKEAFRRLQKRGIQVRTIMGETPVADRRTHVAEFQAGAFPILLMQVKCGKFGLNTSRASTAIYFSNTYDFEDRTQSEDRIVHPSKREPLLFIDLVTRGTVDSAVVAALREKKVNASTFMARMVDHLRREWLLHHGRELQNAPLSDVGGGTLTSRVRRLFPMDRSTGKRDRRNIP
jgi:SNF2 family DNA or RNA helicase